MKRIVLFCLILLYLGSAYAQSRVKETASWTYFSLTKSFDSRWSGGVQTELRTGDDNTRLYLWYLDANARYRINKWLAVSAGFDYIKLHTRRSAVRPAMWLTDWRPYIALIPSTTIGNLKVSLNESLTYNWFPETKKDNAIAKGKAYYLARHRLSLEYPIADTRYTPYSRFEIRHTKTLERYRVTFGTYIKLTPKTTLDVNYIYQEMHHGTMTNAFGLGYRIRL